MAASEKASLPARNQRALRVINLVAGDSRLGRFPSPILIRIVILHF